MQADVAHELAARKCYLQGCDVEGHPVLVMPAPAASKGVNSVDLLPLQVQERCGCAYTQ